MPELFSDQNRSKAVPHAKLQNARVSGARDASKHGGCERRVRIAEIRMVEKVEDLESEFKLVRLRVRHAEVLESREVDDCHTRAPLSVSAQGAECTGSILPKRGSVEPPGDLFAL